MTVGRPGRAEPVPVVLLGGGGHAAVVADALQREHWTALGYLADETSEHAPLVRGDGGPAPLPHLGAPHELQRLLAERLPPRTMVHAAAGDAALRRRWSELIPAERHATIVTPSAVVSPSAVLGAGVFIGPLAVVNARAVIEEGAIVNTGAIVEHDCHVGAFAHVAPRAALGGAARIGADALAGIGSSVLPGVHIGRGAVLGAGSVAIDDVPDGVTVAGAPARTLFVRSAATSPDTPS